MENGKPEDNRTLADLAREALQVQDACNLSGVALGFSRAVSRLRELLESEANGRVSTDRINRHPVCVLWADKLQSLAGAGFSDAYQWAQHEAGVCG